MAVATHKCSISCTGLRPSAIRICNVQMLGINRCRHWLPIYVRSQWRVYDINNLFAANEKSHCSKILIVKNAVVDICVVIHFVSLEGATGDVELDIFVAIWGMWRTSLWSFAHVVTTTNFLCGSGVRSPESRRIKCNAINVYVEATAASVVQRSCFWE